MEIFSNEGVANLNGSITSGATSITVKNAVAIPSSGTFRARIDDEIIKVTAVSGLTWTVTRGDGGSTAAAHNDGATVDVIVTKEALDSIVTVQASGTEVSNRRVLNLTGATVTDDSANGRVNIAISPGGIPWEDSVTAPSLAAFSWVNQGGATGTTTSKGAIFIAAPAASGNNVRALVQSTPGANWTLIARINPVLLNVSTPDVGLLIRDSGGGKLQLYSHVGSNLLQIQNLNSPTSWNSTPFSVANDSACRAPWWKLVQLSGVTTWYMGPDGESWIQIATITTSSYLTSGGNQIGFYAEAQNTTYGSGILLESWATSSP